MTADDNLCNSCGACCQPVVLPHARREIEQMTNRQLGEHTRWWALNVLTPMSRREGLALAPWLRGSKAVPVVNGQPLLHPSSFYRCAWFDEETRLCTHYDERPELCREHPRYGGPVVPVGACLPPMCGYRADQGLEVEPMPAEWQPVTIRGRTT